MTSLKKHQVSKSAQILWETIRKRGLMEWPRNEDPEEFEKSLPKHPYVMDHPFYELRVFVDPMIGQKLFNLIISGDYELLDLALYDLYIKPNDRVVIVGGGIGVAAAFCAKKSGRPVVLVEANDALLPVIAKQAEVNGVSLQTVQGAVVSNSESNKFVDFHFHEEFWFSTTAPTSGQYRTVAKVPTIGLRTLLQTYPADVLIVDIEGGEVGLFDATFESGPSVIFVEIHVPYIGERASATVFANLSKLGYHLVDFRAWMFMFEKEKK